MSNQVESVHHIKEVNLDVLRLETGIYVLCVGVRATWDIGRAETIQSKLETSSRMPSWLSLPVKEGEGWAVSQDERYDCIGYLCLDWFYKSHERGNQLVHCIRKLGIGTRVVMLGSIGWIHIEKDIVELFSED